MVAGVGTVVVEGQAGAFEEVVALVMPGEGIDTAQRARYPDGVLA